MVSDSCHHCGRDSYRSPSVVVDAVVTRGPSESKEVLLIRRVMNLAKECWHSPEDLWTMAKTQRTQLSES